MNHSQIHSAIAGQWPGIAKAARPTPAPSNNLLLDAPEAAALMGISVRLFHKIRPTLPAPVVLSLRAVRWRRSDLEAYISGLQADTSARPEPEQLMRGKAAKRSSRCQLSDAISESKVRLASLQNEHGLRCARIVEKLSVIVLRSQLAADRHGYNENGEPLAYKGYKGDSNYCIEIFRNDKGKWESDVISTFAAHLICRGHGVHRLRHPTLAQNGCALVMRLMNGDLVKAEFKGATRLLQVQKIKSVGAIFVAEHHESNVRKREDAKDPTLIYGSFTAGSIQKSQGRRVTVSEIGDVRDAGFKP